MYYTSTRFNTTEIAEIYIIFTKYKQETFCIDIDIICIDINMWTLHAAMKDKTQI